MAELQARYDNLESSAQSLWRYPIPDGKDVSIGRRSQADLDVPEWNRSDWVVEDPRISGRHVTINFDGKALRVRRRLEPAERPAINPVFYKGKTNDDFQITPGESFTIGSTTFSLQTEQEKPSEPPEPPQGITRTVAREDLRISSFMDAKSPLMALADLPEIIRNTREDVQLEERFLDVLLKGLPLAEFAGFVQIDPKAGDEARAAIVRCKQRGLSNETFRVSNRLVRHATRDVLESVLYIWDKKTEGSAQYSMTMTPGTDWAICTPLDERPNQNRAIYVAGRSPRTIINEDQLQREPEFLDFQKFINLAAELFSTMRDMRRVERQNTQLLMYLPRSLVRMMEQRTNLNQLLVPRIENVTALFCDLRGSSRAAEDTSIDMISAHKRIGDSLDKMTKHIHEKGGIIGGLQGDAAVGFWGWPESREDQIESAVVAALGIRKEFVMAASKACDESVFSCGIGMAHGPGVVGRLGTFDSFKLDAYGMVMNLAARLESLTKYLGVQILVDQVIAERIKKVDPGQARYRLRSLGKVRPAGMTVRVGIFELMPPIYDMPEDNGVDYATWEMAIRFFVEGRWDSAQMRFNRFERSLPDERACSERASKFFIDYITARNNKPPENWDGTIEMDVK